MQSGSSHRSGLNAQGSEKLLGDRLDAIGFAATTV